VRAPEPHTFSARQSEVLDIVEAVFLRDGLRPVRISGLTEEAHCSRSTLYDLAPSKEELFLLVLDRLIRRLRLRNHAVMATTADPVERLRAALAESATGLARISPVFMEAVRDYPPARLLLDQHMREAHANLRTLIDDAITAGAFRPVDAAVATEALQAVIDRFIDPDFVRTTELDVAGALTAFFDMLVDGLRVTA
jgi:AcrR family transcriptional regulator